jgi:enoyl-CoA hydratase
VQHRFVALKLRLQPTVVCQSMPWDPMIDYAYMKGFTDDYTTLWRSLKPTIARVHGVGAVAGGSDIALCCDFVLMEASAKIGYPPARVWGVPTTGFLLHRVGAEQAKRLLLCGDTVTGTEAKSMGLVLDALPDVAELDSAVQRLAERMAGVPRNQLAMIKLMINQTIDASLHTTQVNKFS